MRRIKRAWLKNAKKCVFVQKSSSVNLDAPRRAAYDAQVLLVNERGETCEQRFG